MSALHPRSSDGSRRRPTATSQFGSGRREGHDSSAFYQRFVPPEISDDDTIERNGVLDALYLHDARSMGHLEPSSVALVVTSPPYFAGKEYELSLGVGGVPATYFQYLELLRDVFAECKRVLEPGGRIAVNVANLGRRPYRALSADVAGILSDLGLLLRGEVIWCKGRAASGSCAWGTFQRPANPVLRDVTERIVIASKGRFDRALGPAERARRSLPSIATVSRDEFMEATTDLWEIPPESATRVGHPAPFPVELPQRLIELYTYRGDVVLDPFLGSGSTAVAAVRTGRHYIGYDTEATYLATATQRIAEEQRRLARDEVVSSQHQVPLDVEGAGAPGGDHLATDRLQPRPLTEAIAEGQRFSELARILVETSGFTELRQDVRLRGLGITLDLLARDSTGAEWGFDVSGALTCTPNGLRRGDTLWRSLGKAGVLHQSTPGLPLVLLTTAKPPKGSPGSQALAAMCGPARPVRDVIELLDAEDRARLRSYAIHGREP